MSLAHSLTRPALVALALALTACSEGKGNSDTGFVTTFPSSQGQSSNETNTTADTGTPIDSEGTAASVTTGPADDTTGPEPTTMAIDPSTTNVDPSTTTTDPSTTNVDPSTTTTGVDPSTTTTIGEETTDDPPPPVKDPQPANGLYEHCLDNTPCDAALTDGCFTITNEMDVVFDGYCTVVCAQVADCGPKPNAPAVQECLTINLNPMQKVCALKCNGVADCPTGMACTNLALPNNVMGGYCT